MARVGERLSIAQDQAFEHNVVFHDSAGAAYDPTTVTCTVLEPDGVQTTYTYGGGEIVKVATGNYYLRTIGDKAGQWVSRFLGVATGFSDSDEIAVRVLRKRTS